MSRRILPFLIITMMILFLIPNSMAQPEPSLGNWELGIEYPDEDDSNPFIVSEAGLVSIKMFVDNQGLLSVKVSFEYDFPFEGEVVGAPEDATVDAGSNDSFNFMVRSIDVYEVAAGTKETFTITANLEERNGMPVILPESQEKTGDLEIPEIFMLNVEITDPVGPINAGTDTILKVTVTNEGNARDKVRELEVTDDCPLMTTDEGLDVLLTRNLEKGAKTTADLKVTASESHPQRNCRIEVTVASDGADGTQLSTDFTRITVEPPPTNSQDPNDPSENEDPVEVVTSNLPAAGISVILSVLFGAIITRSNRRF
ncbi:MAG: hypothetical protein NZ780_02015 [Candidatus Poseidoniales archaeon]|nr:hypothetical protein [Candidatus Poseidoniales archaeon]MED6312630.1 hypothetical protein [Candidatus Thermoplasmatota archaeon]